MRSEKLRALGEMASGVAHDFNNVLGAILARAQLLKASVDGTDLAQELLRSPSSSARPWTARRPCAACRISRACARPHVVARVGHAGGGGLPVAHPRPLARRGGTPRSPLRGDDAARRDPAVAGQASELREALTNMILNALDAHAGRRGAPPRRARRRARRDRARGQGYGPRHERRGPGAHLRPVLHDQGRARHRPRPVGRLRHRAAPRRPDRGRERTRSGHARRDALPLPPRRRAVGEPAGRPARPRAALDVLVVDDEEDVRALLRDDLRALGHRTRRSSPARTRSRTFAPASSTSCSPTSACPA